MRVALMLASTLHAIATGNVLPASVETFCIDINPAVVTKLSRPGQPPGPRHRHRRRPLPQPARRRARGLSAVAAGDLTWGRRFLMCPPTHFGVIYEINPWMHAEVAVDGERARAQWDGLVATLGEAGAEVETIEQDAEVPDLVFTANAGIVSGRPVRPVALPPPRAPARDRALRLLVRRPRVPVERLPGRPRPRGRGRRPPLRRRRSRAPRSCCRATASGPTPRPRRRSRPSTGAVVRPDRAGRRAAVPPRPHVLPARRPPGPVRAARAGTATATTVVEALVPEPLWLDRRGGARLHAPTRSSSARRW